MASKFVRNITEVKDINQLAQHVTTQNDLIQSTDGSVYIVTKNGYEKITGGLSESEITELKSENTKLKKRVTDLETVNDEQATKVSELETTNSEQDTKISDLETTNSEQDTKISDLETSKPDTSNWQKYKLTENNGDRISKSDIDVVTLETGFFEGSSITGLPHDEGSRWFIDVYHSSGNDAKIIKATLGYTGQVYQRTIYGDSDSDWKELTGLQDLITRIEKLENPEPTE